MGQIQTATYRQPDSSTAVDVHRIYFNRTATKGNRLIIAVSSYQPIVDTSPSWDRVTYTTSDGHFIGIFTKMSLGTETSFYVRLAEASRVCHMWMCERDDIPEQVTGWSGRNSGTKSFSLSKAGYIVGAFHHGGESVQYATNWPLNMSVVHRATNSSSSGYDFSSDFAAASLNSGSYSINAANLSSIAPDYTFSFAVFTRDSQAPTKPGNFVVVSTGYGSATTQWSPSTDNVGVTRYTVYVDGAQVGQTTATTYTFSGLPSGRQIELGVAAHDAAGNRSAIATTYVFLDATPPTPPSRLRLTAMTTTSLTVAWDPAQDSGGYVVEYGVYLNGVQVGTRYPGNRTYTFTGLVTNQQYVIEVDAVDDSGNRSSRAILRATPKIDTTPPDPPVIRVTYLAAGRIDIAWDEPFDDTQVTSYSVYRGTTKVADTTAQSYEFRNLTPGALYQLGVEAVDLSGNRSARAVRSIRAQADTTPPTVPTGLRAVAITQTSITVAWDASTDDNSGIGGYRVYLANDLLATIPSQVYTITGLSPGITYRIGVAAVDQVGNASARTEITVATKPDTSGAAPPYEFQFVDWATGEPIDSLPLQNVQITLGLAGSSRIEAEIPLYDPEYTVGRVTAATRPERTMLIVYRGDRFIAGGRVVDPQDYDSETGILRITVEDPIQIYSRRFVKYTGLREATLAHAEVEWLIEHNASARDRAWLTFAGVTSTAAVDREYKAEDFPRILEQVNAVAEGEGGFDWWVKPSWDPVNDRPQFQFRRVSRDDPPDTGLVLEYPGNVRGYKLSTSPGLETATHGKLTVEDGGVLLSAYEKSELLAAGWPLIEEAYQFDGLTSQEALDAETRRAADAAAGSKHLYEFTLMPGTGVKWWDLEIGGRARVVITDARHPEREDGAPGLDRYMTIVSIRIVPQSDQGEQVVITTGEFTVDVD